MRKEISIPLLLIGSILALGFSRIMNIQSDYQPISNENKVESALWNLSLDLSDYKNWYKITEGNPNTGDPTGFLGGRHKGVEAYREVYVNKVGEEINKGTMPYKYPAGTMIVKEEYKNEAAWKIGKNPSIKLMLKLETGESPETGDWGFASKLNVKKIATGKSSKAKFCSGCHVFVAAQGDYIFMNGDFLKTE